LQTKVTPIVEGYGGWAFRMEVVPIESAYPGFGELVVSMTLINISHLKQRRKWGVFHPSYYVFKS
jgi:hypothetical protein